MESQLVTFEQAKSLKELGFSQSEKHKIYTVNDGLVDCVDFSYIAEGLKEGRTPDEIINAPSLELAAKWLREEKNIFIRINCILPQYEFNIKWNSVLFNLPNESSPLGFIADTLSDLYNTYEEALIAGIDKTLEYLSNDKGNNA